MLYSQINPIFTAFWTTWNSLSDDNKVGIVCGIALLEAVTVVPLCILNLGKTGGVVAMLIILVPFALFMAGAIRRQRR